MESLFKLIYYIRLKLFLPAFVFDYIRVAWPALPDFAIVPAKPAAIKTA